MMENWAGLGFVLVLIFIILWAFATSVYIVSQAKAYVIERFGSYMTTWDTGFHLKIPFIDRVAHKLNLREQVRDFEPQAVITKDNVKMSVDSVVFFQITDPKLFAYGVKNPIAAIEHLTATSLRNVFGDLELDESLTSRDIINTKMRSILDEATDPWGIKVTRVELKSIVPPHDIQQAMEKQMRAERERREKILLAEGDKDAAVLRAEGTKKAQILAAQGDKEARILEAEADREAAIRRAEGEADAILKIQNATAEGLRMLNASHPTKEVLTIKSLEALQGVADGQATKLIIPSELQNIASITASIAETFNAVKE